jgi:DNA-binding response OmpR family regulator
MRRMRQRAQTPPAIILLTARGEESDRIVGLQLGADDYVVKPFSPRELVARVDAVLRRATPEREPGPPLVVGPLTIDPAAHQVRCGGEELALTQRELELLTHLARHPGRVFTREELIERVWKYSFYTDTSTVTVHVRRVRAKLETAPGGRGLIETVWGVGYRLGTRSACA